MRKKIDDGKPFDTLNAKVVVKARMSKEVLDRLRADGLEIKETISNEWGFSPIEYKVLIEVEEVEKLAGKERRIIIPDSVASKFQVAQIKGKIIAMGGNAFEEIKGTVPQLGDKVYFAKYSGVQLNMDDKDGKRREARVVNDKDVIGVLDPEIENIEV